MAYDPRALSAFFDEYAEREWDRLETTLPGRIKASIHSHILQKYLRPGLSALDIGCGPGRFAAVLASHDIEVTLADISEGQLNLAQQTLSEAGLADCVSAYHRCDVTDLGVFDDESFDITVCFGSVLSYVREEYPTALRELRRVTRSGGTILVSTTSIYGPFRLVGILDAEGFASAVPDHLDWDALVDGEGVVMTNIGSEEFHQPMAMFSAAGLRSALEEAELEVVEMATSNPTVAMGFALPKTEKNEVAEAFLTELEISLCQKPGLVDAGEHIIAVARKP